MGKNNFTNWATGYNNGCTTCSNNDCGCTGTCTGNCAACTDCGCEQPAACDCGCGSTANTCTCNSTVTPCTVPVADGTHIYYETCDGFKQICVTGACQQEAAPGRVLDVNATLVDVCPGRRSALGFALTEVDENGAEYARGFQAVTVPAHNGSCNQDIQVDTVRFVLPEDQSLQARRHFIVRTQHHYLDASSIWNNSWGGSCK